MDSQYRAVRVRPGETNLLAGIPVTIDNNLPSGVTYLINYENIHHLVTSPYSDIGWPNYYPKLIESTKRDLARSLQALVIQTRFELGLPLR